MPRADQILICYNLAGIEIQIECWTRVSVGRGTLLLTAEIVHRGADQPRSRIAIELKNNDLFFPASGERVVADLTRNRTI
jgi:hypothetical protein